MILKEIIFIILIEWIFYISILLLLALFGYRISIKEDIIDVINFIINIGLDIIKFIILFIIETIKFIISPLSIVSNHLHTKILFSDVLGKKVYPLYKGIKESLNDEDICNLDESIESRYNTGEYKKVDYINRIKLIDLYLDINNNISTSFIVTLIIAIVSFTTSVDESRNPIVLILIFILIIMGSVLLPFLLLNTEGNLLIYYLEEEKKILIKKLESKNENDLDKLVANK
ncbi:hypothetical protein GKD10_03120 [Paeniclostridium sordellii]|nr:hypothetical protein [Paeniclostridium sordellii]